MSDLVLVAPTFYLLLLSIPDVLWLVWIGKGDGKIRKRSMINQNAGNASMHAIISLSSR